MKETIPFTYKLIFKPTGQYYYGVKWSKGCNPSDLWVSYFTSSKHIHKLIEEYGKNSFEYRVTKTFYNKIEAALWETEVLKRVNANRNGSFINKANNMPIHDNSGLKIIHHTVTNKETFHDPKIPLPSGWLYGRSVGHNDKISKSLIGHTPWNKGVKLAPSGPCSEERRENIKKSRLKTEKIKCEFCDKECDPGNHKRFHGYNCKHNPNIDESILKERSDLAKKSLIKQKINGNYSQPKPKKGNFICPHCDKLGTNYGAMIRHHFDNCRFRE